MGWLILFIALLLVSSCSNIKPEDELNFCEIGMEIDEARDIAMRSECADEGTLKEDYFYNENSRTYWINMDVEGYPLCNPACVVDVVNYNASINWRCTGAIEN